MIGTEDDGIFFYDISSQTFIKKMKGEKIWEDSILQLNSRKMVYGGRSFKSSTFAYLTASKTPTGIILAEANGPLSYYNNRGELCWKTDCSDFGHFVNIHYDKYQNIVLGVLLNPRNNKNERMRFVVLNQNTGKILSQYPIETASYVFVDHSESVMLVNGKGRIYTFIDKQLVANNY